ncbi:hypothetical protein E2C01_082992 [Portunus trituberculatus]|uniref:Uncharacterized protein n=1 Tax=Portunus trituberculatus TaxID=210409 RepID=A0A5B7ITR0_PORTR|nr:hypothetical protein [Portunus trituberculatus]
MRQEWPPLGGEARVSERSPRCPVGPGRCSLLQPARVSLSFVSFVCRRRLELSAARQSARPPGNIDLQSGPE